MYFLWTFTHIIIMKELEVKLSQNIDQIKEYHRCGSSMDGVDLTIEYKNGETESFHSSTHTFQKTVNEIQKYWNQSKP